MANTEWSTPHLCPPLFKDLNQVQLGYEDTQCDVNSDLLNMVNM